MESSELIFTTPEGQTFFEKAFLPYREVTMEQYQSMLPKESSDTKFKPLLDATRARIVHNIEITRDYARMLPFNTRYEDLSSPADLSNEELLNLLSQTTREVAGVLTKPDLTPDKIEALGPLSNYETGQNFLNMVEMNSLDIAVGPKQQAMWGKDGYLGPKQI